MSIERKTLIERLTVVALVMSLLLNAGAVLGGFKWVLDLSKSVEDTAKAATKLGDAVLDLSKWRVETDKRHAIEDALKEKEAEAGRFRRSRTGG